MQLTFLSAHFDRHGLLLARGVPGGNGDQVGGIRFEVSEERGVLGSAYRGGVELAPGQGGVLNVVTCDRVWLKRTPTYSNAGISRLSDFHHGRADHLWCAGRHSQYNTV